MDSSETHINAIKLGRELVALLNLEPGGNTLTRWMAHYVAEQMTLAEQSTGAAKVAAEERCFNTVLALWKQRTAFPSGCRPFENFEPILRTLARLDPDAPKSFFHRFSKGEQKDTHAENAEVIELMEFVESLDVTARVLIELALKAAVDKAMSNATKTILQQALTGEAEVDIKVLQQLVKQNAPIEENAPEAIAKVLEKQIEQLDRFLDVCKGVRNAFLKDLKSLRKGTNKQRLKK